MNLKKYIRDKFPTYGESNILYFYLLSLLSSSWFQIGNWLLFVLLFMSAKTFAGYEAIAFGIGILFEIPSGAFADLMGKKRTVQLGMFLLTLGSIIFTLAYFGNGMLFFGNLIIIVSFAFLSGSLEALVYDTLVEKGKTDHYDEIIGKSRSLEIIALIIAGLIGALLWNLSVYGPWVACCVVFAIGFLVSFKFIEPTVDTEHFSWKNFVRQNNKGFYYLFKSDFRKYTFSFAAILGAYLMWSIGIIRVVMGIEFNYDGTTLNLLITATLLVSFFVNYYFKSIRQKLGDFTGFSLLLLIATFGWVLAAISNNFIIGAVVFLFITMTGNLADSWVSVILNKHVLSRDRATAISTLSFLVQLPYVLIVVWFGTLIENGTTSFFYYCVAAILAVSVAVFYRAEKANVIVKKAPKL